MKSLRLSQFILRSSMVCALAAVGCDSSNDDESDSDESIESSKDEAKSDAKAESKVETKDEAEAADKGDQEDAKPDDEAKAESKEEAKDEPKSEAKSEPKEEPKTEPEKKPEEKPAVPPLYGVSTISNAGDETLSYINLIESLDGQTLDFADAREFSGQADLWVSSGEIFISDGESLEIGKYSLQEKEKTLKEAGKVNFSSTGVTEVGFWTSVFISPEKAYVFNTAEMIVWNPKTLEITGTIKLPEFADRGTLTAFPGYSDRAAVIRGKRLFQPVYWTSTENFFSYDKASQILVIDIEKDEIVETLDAPCPGLDFATQDDDGNIYYSSWIFAPAAAAVLDEPATCITKIPAGDDTKVETAFNVAEITGGLEGGAMRYVGSGKFILSVLDPAHEKGEQDVETIGWGPNWQFWSFDLKSKKAEPITSIDWNAGAAYTSKVGSETYMLVPDGSYANTTFYRVTGSIDPKPVLKTKGWSMRLFQLR